MWNVGLKPEGEKESGGIGRSACANKANYLCPIAISLVHHKVASQCNAKDKTDEEQLEVVHRINRRREQSRPQPGKGKEDDGTFDGLVHGERSDKSLS